jgi:hypothetical protein
VLSIEHQDQAMDPVEAVTESVRLLRHGERTESSNSDTWAVGRRSLGSASGQQPCGFGLRRGGRALRVRHSDRPGPRRMVSSGPGPFRISQCAVSG